MMLDRDAAPADIDIRALGEQGDGDEDLGLAALRVVVPFELDRPGLAGDLAVLVVEAERRAGGGAGIGAGAEVGPGAAGGLEDAEVLGVPAVLGLGVPARGVIPLRARGQCRVEAIVEGPDIVARAGDVRAHAEFAEEQRGVPLAGRSRPSTRRRDPGPGWCRATARSHS